MNEKNQRNGLLEVIRFIAAISILIYHFELIYLEKSVHFMHLYIWVEFFFIISGFFLAKNVNVKTSALEYTWKQLKKMYPIYILGFITLFILNNIYDQVNLESLLFNLWEAKFEIFLVNIFSFNPYAKILNLGGASSYISALLIGTLFLYYIIQNHKKVFQNLAPIFILIGYCVILNAFGNLSQWANLLVIPSGLIRALCDLSVGSFLYLSLNDKFQQYGNVKNSIIFIITFLFTGGLIVFKNYINSFDLVFYVAIFGLLVISAYNIKIPLKNRFNWEKLLGKDILNKICIYLGHLSYPIFIFHYIVLFYFKNFLSPMSYKKELISVIFFTILISIVIVFIQNKIIFMLKQQKKSV